MRRLRKVKDYTKQISKETGIPRWKVHIVLMFAWMNVVRMIGRGEEIRLKGFGRIYINKDYYAKKTKGRTTSDTGDRVVRTIEPIRDVFDDL